MIRAKKLIAALSLVLLARGVACADAVSSQITGMLTSPAGSNGQVQFNKRNSFGADSTLTFSTVTKSLSVSTLTITGRGIVFPDGTVQVSSPSASGGSGTPGGATTQVQFNDDSAFNGVPGMTFYKSTVSFQLQGNYTTGSAPDAFMIKSTATYANSPGAGVAWQFKDVTGALQTVFEVFPSQSSADTSTSTLVSFNVRGDNTLDTVLRIGEPNGSTEPYIDLPTAGTRLKFNSGGFGTGYIEANQTSGDLTFSPTSSNNRLRFGNGGTSAVLMYWDASGNDGDMTWDGTNNVFLWQDAMQLQAQKELRLADSDSSNYVALKSSAAVGSNVSWVIPASDGTSGQAITTDGSGVLSFSNVTTSPAGSDTYIQYNNAGVFGGSSDLVREASGILRANTELKVGYYDNPFATAHVDGIDLVYDGTNYDINFQAGYAFFGFGFWNNFARIRGIETGTNTGSGAPYGDVAISVQGPSGTLEETFRIAASTGASSIPTVYIGDPLSTTIARFGFRTTSSTATLSYANSSLAVSTTVSSPGINISDTRSGTDYPILAGRQAFPNAPGTTLSGLSFNGLVDVSCAGTLRAGQWTESGYTYNIGINSDGQGDLNNCQQGGYLEFTANQGEASIVLAVKDNLSLLTGGDLPALQVSEYGTLNLGRGHTLGTDTTNAEVEIKAYDANTVPLQIDVPGGSSVNLQNWENNGVLVADVSKNGDFETTVGVVATGDIQTTAGHFYGPAGSVAAPTYTSIINSASGIYFPGTNSLAIANTSRKHFEVSATSVAVPSPFTTYLLGGVVTSSATVQSTIPLVTLDDTGGISVEDWQIKVDEAQINFLNSTDGKTGITINGNENVGIGANTNPDAAAHLTILGSDSTYAHMYLIPGTIKSTLGNGYVAYTTAQNNMIVGVSGVPSWGYWDIAVATATKTLTNSSAETNLWNNVMSDTTTIPSSSLTASKTFEIEADGLLSTDAVSGPQLQFKVYFGTIAILDSGLFATTSALANERWRIEGMVTVRTTGTTGLTMATGRAILYDTGASSTLRIVPMGSTTATVVPTGSARTIYLSGKFDVADTDNILTMETAKLTQTH